MFDYGIGLQFFSMIFLQVAEADQATFTDLVRELTQHCVTDLEKARYEIMIIFKGVQFVTYGDNWEGTS